MQKRPQTPDDPDTNIPQSKSVNSNAPLEIDARALLGSRREAMIIHAGERYRLRITANNKLILTK